MTQHIRQSRSGGTAEQVSEPERVVQRDGLWSVKTGSVSPNLAADKEKIEYACTMRREAVAELRAVVVVSRETAERFASTDGEVQTLFRENDVVVDEVDNLVGKREEGMGLSREEDVGSWMR